MSPIYALKLGSRSAEPANVNSLSILVQLAVMVTSDFSIRIKKPLLVRGLKIYLVLNENQK